ncbi:MAG: GAF and ANTAR domain-containing protein [Propionibacteriales bacterium]|nr:GAF and ANTAR domain-containing protein [Propionibacteriales bacterium]
MTEDRVLDTVRRLSASLTPGDLDHTLSRITAAAVEVLPGVHYASITVKHADGRLETVAPTDEMLLGVDAAQYELGEGPCYDAAVDATYVSSPNLAADERFLRYAAMAVKAGIRAQAGVRLFETPKPSAQGALNLYSRDVGSFTDMSVVSQLFAHQSAMALDYAREVENLQEAVRTRQAVGRAVGIVMERYGLTEERAFAFLARVSQTRNVKLREVAAEIVADMEARARG